MSSKQKTAFDKYFDRRMKNPEFATDYKAERAEIDATDKLIRALDGIRERAGVSKSELAQRINAKPALVRRLLTSTDGNPTMDTVLKVVLALNCHLELVPNRVSGKKTARPKQAA